MSAPPAVVVIEDDTDISTLVCSRLRAEGYDVHPAATGIVGLALVGRLIPAAVVLDLGLPDIDGHEVIRRLAAQGSTAAIPVVVVSVRDRDAAWRHLGIAGYVGKPIVRGHLESAVRRAIAARAACADPAALGDRSADAATSRADRTEGGR